MDEETQESWAISKGNLDTGLQFILRFREDLPDEREQKRLKILIVVSWEFDSEDGTGMPSAESRRSNSRASAP